MVFGWLKNASINQQKNNIKNDLLKLINIVNISDNYFIKTGMLDNDIIKKVHSAQSNLLFSIVGPLELEDIKKEFFDPILNNENCSNGLRMSIINVYDTAISER